MCPHSSKLWLEARMVGPFPGACLGLREGSAEQVGVAERSVERHGKRVSALEQVHTLLNLKRARKVTKVRVLATNHCIDALRPAP